MRVGRAWPGDERGLVVEGRDVLGRVRAGRLPRDGGPPRLTPYGTDSRLPALPEVLARPGAELLVHRLGKRAVVRLPGCYAKVVRAPRLPGLADRSAAGARVGEAAGFVVPRVCRADPAGVLETTIVPGTPLHDTGGAPTADDAWCTAWAGWAERWQRLLGLDTGRALGADASVHDAVAELGVLEHWVGQAVADGVLPDRDGATRAALDRVAALLASSPVQPLVPAHRDLHDKQLLAGEGGSVGLLDFDTLTLAEPALDLANLRVHLLLRRDQGRWSPARTAVALAAVDRVLARCGVDPERTRAYAAATALRLACVHAYRPADRALALWWWERLVAPPGGDERSLMAVSSGSHAGGGDWVP